MNSYQFFELTQHTNKEMQKEFSTIQLEQEYEKIVFSHPSFTFTAYLEMDFEHATLYVRHECTDDVGDEEELISKIENKLYTIIHEYIDTKKYNIFVYIEHSFHFERTLFSPEGDLFDNKSFFACGEKGKQTWNLLSQVETKGLQDGQYQFLGLHIMDKELIIVPRIPYGCVDVYYTNNANFNSYRYGEDDKIATFFQEEEIESWVAELAKEYEDAKTFESVIQKNILKTFPDYSFIKENGCVSFCKHSLRPIIKKIFTDEFWGYTWGVYRLRFTSLDEEANETILSYLKNIITEYETYHQLLRSLYDFDPYSFRFQRKWDNKIFLIGKERDFKLELEYKFHTDSFELNCRIDGNSIQANESSEKALQAFEDGLKQYFGGERMNTLFKENELSHTTKQIFELSGDLGVYVTERNKKEKECKQHYLDTYGETCPFLITKKTR